MTLTLIYCLLSALSLSWAADVDPSASSTDLLLVVTTPVLPDGVYINGDLGGPFPLFCAPDIGSGGCVGPTITENVGPGRNFGGPYQVFWSDQVPFCFRSAAPLLFTKPSLPSVFKVLFSRSTTISIVLSLVPKFPLCS